MAVTTSPFYTHSGIGLAVCRELARRGATVLMACRDEGKGTDALMMCAALRRDVRRGGALAWRGGALAWRGGALCGVA